MNSIKSLVIVQPYVPKYRVAFFEQLILSLADQRISCKIAASNPDTLQTARGDAVNPSWVIPTKQKSIAIGGKTIGLGGSRPAWKDADGVILGLLGSSIDTYMALLDAKRRQLKVGLWGHVKPYVSDGNPIDLALERLQMTAADHIFAYTPGGASYAQEAGVKGSKITTVMNSVDTTSLADAVLNVSEDAASEFASRNGVIAGKTLAYIGGLDESKRIEFLAAALDVLWVEAPELKVLVGGRGDQEILLQRAVTRGQCVLLGYVDHSQQALIARTASALLMPGRIGLVAVDALVLGLPIITTDWPYHAPEAEYLVEGTSRVTSDNNVSAYAATIKDFIDKNPKHFSNAPLTETYPTIQSMVSNYVSGVVKMLGTEGGSK